jgi:hypothetical protein
MCVACLFRLQNDFNNSNKGEKIEPPLPVDI